MDFHPTNIISLPPKLNPPLNPQRFAFQFRICAGLGCQTDEELEERLKEMNKPRATFIPLPSIIPTKNMNCFCLDLYIISDFSEPNLSEDSLLF